MVTNNAQIKVVLYHPSLFLIHTMPVHGGGVGRVNPGSAWPLPGPGSQNCHLTPVCAAAKAGSQTAAGGTLAPEASTQK